MATLAAGGGINVLTGGFLGGFFEMTHIDDWLDEPGGENIDGIHYAKFVLNYFRYPAWLKMAFRPWMEEHKLFCTYQNKRYRVTGASRMGDIWITSNFDQDTGYELRVDVAECGQWSASKDLVLEDLNDSRGSDSACS